MEGEFEKDELCESNETITLCMICQINPFKYKCPNCSILTCCCSCVKLHKAQTGCTGQRNRANYIPIQSFGDKQLRNDIVQTKNSANRTLISTGGHENSRKSEMKQRLISKTSSFQGMLSNSAKIQNHSANSSRLLKGAQQHGVKLSLMPNGMSKRISNTTRYHKNVDKIFWKVHVIFVLNNEYTPSTLLQYDLNGLNSNSSLLGLNSSNETLKSLRNSSIDEETSISDIITQFLSTTSDQLANRHHLRYLRSRQNSLKCILHKVPSPASEPVFFEVPINFSLRNALSGKIVIEYPTLIIGPDEFLTKVKYFVQELNNSEHSEGDEVNKSIHPSKRHLEEEVISLDINEINISDVTIKHRRLTPSHEGKEVEEEEEEEQHMSLSLPLPLSQPSHLQQENNNEEEDEDEEQEQELGLGLGGSSHPFLPTSQIESGDDDDDDDDDGEEDGSGEEFIKQLELFQNQDISSLQQLIDTMEKN